MIFPDGYGTIVPNCLRQNVDPAYHQSDHVIIYVHVYVQYDSCCVYMQILLLLSSSLNPPIPSVRVKGHSNSVLTLASS